MFSLISIIRLYFNTIIDKIKHILERDCGGGVLFMKNIKYMLIINFIIIMTVMSGCGGGVEESLPVKEVMVIEKEKDIEPNIEKEMELKEEVIEFNIKMVGDNLVNKTLCNDVYREYGEYDFTRFFENVNDELTSADLAIINQETIFVKDNNDISSYPRFGIAMEMGDALVEAGIDVVAHATNHTVDKGLQSVFDTIEYWDDTHPNMVYLGIHKDENDCNVRFYEEKDVKIGLVNYTYGLNGLEGLIEGNEYIVDMLSDSGIDEDLEFAKNNSDFVIAILHVGNEYTKSPSDYAKESVDKMIDGGADLVLCAHPHVVQEYLMVTTEAGNEGLVYYSVGNFISMQDELPRLIGGMADITIEKVIIGDESSVSIKSFDMHPLFTHQRRGEYTTYMLEDYTEELCKRHNKLSSFEINLEIISKIFNEYTAID